MSTPATDRTRRAGESLLQVSLDGQSHEIRFEPGASSGSINDVVVPGTARQNMLEASADQVLYVSIDAEHLIRVDNGVGFLEVDVGAVVTVLPATGVNLYEPRVR